ncbi:hypothetical protein BDP55DRAFT_730774 [Colletotrichum godetiae]|uniref:lytic cellulose monooxygenase (C4-dehydrogenating) n=1 Tax=Colletotrichum godetiae TaxID=1209918 RepID=A0AAJ0AJ06_9PEZI|nr:uncharacterized protein BDP55DRAFT_730774 [Colletotrichum godetiae]KAK1673333.1 hypothetical protein BDP55DRAFT_730774 [Colletotrichum godetiae]
MKLTFTTIVGGLAATTTAHGFVQHLMLGENLVDTWNPYKDPSKKVNKITRKFKDNGPVTDGLFTTDAITCNTGSDKNNVPATETASVPAGSIVKFMWTEWKSDHPGPSTRIS